MGFSSRRFVPRLELLDGRCVPAVVALQGTTLSITAPAGDTTADSVAIIDYGPVVNDEFGNYVSGGVTALVNGVTYPEHVDLSAIVIDTGAGNDKVTYDLWAPLPTTRLISVSLGRGADSFVADLHGQTISGAATNLGISAYGDGGGDSLVLNANGATVSPEARLSVDFHGQAGKDAICFNYDPGFLDLGNVTLSKDQKH